MTDEANDRRVAGGTSAEVTEARTNPDAVAARHGIDTTGPVDNHRNRDLFGSGSTTSSLSGTART